MKFFKIIKDNIKFIGVATSDSFRYFQRKHNLILSCNEIKAQYLICNGEFYRDYWMSPTINNNIKYIIASISEIDEFEYNSLKQAIDEGKDFDIPLQSEEETSESTSIEEELLHSTYPEKESITLDYVKNLKISVMNVKCKHAITSGIDIFFESTFINEHFDLTIEDQINLNSLRYEINSKDRVPYHCKGGEFKYYSKQDILTILGKMDNHILFHNSYFNSLKKYINSLTDYRDVVNIEYGQDFPNIYKSDILMSFSMRDYFQQ